jgi:hypothetical protein
MTLAQYCRIWLLLFASWAQESTLSRPSCIPRGMRVRAPLPLGVARSVLRGAPTDVTVSVDSRQIEEDADVIPGLDAVACAALVHGLTRLAVGLAVARRLRVIQQITPMEDRAATTFSRLPSLGTESREQHSHHPPFETNTWAASQASHGRRCARSTPVRGADVCGRGVVASERHDRHWGRNTLAGDGAPNSNFLRSLACLS